MNGLAHVESEQEKVKEIINKFEEVLVNDQKQFTSENLEKFNLIKDNLNKTIDEMAQDWKYLLYTNDKEYKKRVIREKNTSNEKKLNDLVSNLNKLDYNDVESINKTIDKVVKAMEAENLLYEMEMQLSNVGNFEDLKCEINSQALFSLDDSSILDSYNESLENISKNSGFNANIITRVEALKTKMSSLYETRYGANKEEQQKLLNQEIYDSYLKENNKKRDIFNQVKDYLLMRKRGMSLSDKNLIKDCENYLLSSMKQEEDNLYQTLFPREASFVNGSTKTINKDEKTEKLFEPFTGLNQDNLENYSEKTEKLFGSIRTEILYNNLNKILSNNTSFEDLEKEYNGKSLFKVSPETIISTFDKQFNDIKKNNYHIDGIDKKVDDLSGKLQLLYSDYLDRKNDQKLNNSESEILPQNDIVDTVGDVSILPKVGNDLTEVEDEKDLTELNNVEDTISDISVLPKDNNELNNVEDTISDISVLPKDNNELNDIVNKNEDSIQKPKTEKITDKIKKHRKISLFVAGAIVGGVANISTGFAATPILNIIGSAGLMSGITIKVAKKVIDKINKNRIVNVVVADEKQIVQANDLKSKAKKYLTSDQFATDIMTFSSGLLAGSNVSSFINSKFAPIDAVPSDNIVSYEPNVDPTIDPSLPDVPLDTLPDATMDPILPDASVDVYGYDDVVLGDSIQGADITSGYTNSYDAINGVEQVSLNTNLVNGDASNFTKFGIFDDNGKLVELISDNGTSVQDLIEQGINPDNISALVGSSEGSQAWVGIEEVIGKVR